MLSIIPFEDEDEAVRLANGTHFGLAAGVWTRDIARAHRMARRLQAGTVWINIYRAMTFNSPFGGYKSSGIGRAERDRGDRPVPADQERLVRTRRRRAGPLRVEDLTPFSEHGAAVPGSRPPGPSCWRSALWDRIE